MISTPQEIEQNAMAIANWIVYNNRPFVLPAEGGKSVYLCVLSEQDMEKLQAQPVTVSQDEGPSVEQ